MTSNRKVRLSVDAEDDLTDILEYTIETWGQERAETYRSRLFQGFRDLADYPALGRTRNEFGLGTRDHIVGQHVIIYRFTDTELIVLRIVHVR
jgi:toxin ParE1/3/4